MICPYSNVLHENVYHGLSSLQFLYASNGDFFAAPQVRVRVIVSFRLNENIGLLYGPSVLSVLFKLFWRNNNFETNAVVWSTIRCARKKVGIVLLLYDSMEYHWPIQQLLHAH